MPRAFVDELKHAPEGTVFLANVLAAQAEGLLTRAQIAAFFGRCAALRSLDSATRAMVHVRSVCNGSDGGTALRRAHLAAGSDGLRLTTVVPWKTWFDHHLDYAKIERAASHALIREPGASDEFETLARYIEDVCAQPQWWKLGIDEACLGAPYSTAGSCWLSTSDHDAGQSVPTGDITGSAYRVASACGLLYAPDTWLLRYSVDAAQARAAATSATGRPTFADGGNEWFRVSNRSPYGRHCSSRGWGNTAHLLSSGPGSCDGRPERVYLRLPISQLPSLEVRLLGKVEAKSSDPPRMDEAAFEQIVLNGSTLDAIVNELKSWLP